MVLTVAAIDAIRKELAAIPPKDDAERELNREDAIARMSAEVLALRSRGYSWEEVAAFVTRKGCRISASALKTRLCRKGLTSRTKKPRAGGGGPSPKAAARDEPKAPRDKSAEPVGAQAVVARAPAPVPKLPLGSFALREDSKDL